jgi:transcriptional regulator with XRE-family HTH domain
MVLGMTTTASGRERHQPPAVGIRILREAHGLTIPALVDRIGLQGVTVTADHISNVELGWKRPSNALLTAWAKALGINKLDVLLAEDVPAPRVSA